MNTHATHRKYHPPEIVAARLGLPAAWLRREIEAGRLPAIKAGRRTLVSLEAVEDALLRRAAGSEATPCK